MAAEKILEKIMLGCGGQFVITKNSAGYLLIPHGSLDGPFAIEDYQPLIDVGILISDDSRSDVYIPNPILQKMFWDLVCAHHQGLIQPIADFL